MRRAMRGGFTPGKEGFAPERLTDGDGGAAWSRHLEIRDACEVPD
jgi:hypothetical protein